MEKPTIEELERLLDGTDRLNLQIMPNGEIKMACKNCLKLQERIEELEKSLQQNVEPDLNAMGFCPKCGIRPCDCENLFGEEKGG